MADFTNMEWHPFLTQDSVELVLHRWKAEDHHAPGVPVLLLHGASAGHETFMIPKPHGTEPRSLADWLHTQGYEPWLLDWRGSKNITLKESNQRGELMAFREGEIYNFDNVAKYDIPKALEEIRRLRDKQFPGDDKPIGAVGWCMGAGTLAQAIVQGHVSKKQHGLSHVVLMTLGLFYETPVDSRLKAEERLLEALIASESVSFVDPRVLKNEYNWPTTIQALYDGWSGRLKPHDDVEPNNARGDDPTEKMRQALDMCNRLSFMYGMPYAEKNLVSEIHHPGWEMSFDSGKHNPSVGDEIKITGSKAKGILAYSRPLESGAWDTQNAAGKLVLTKVEGDFTKGESLAVKGNIIGTFRGLGETIPPELLNQFGAIPINMYLHGAQNIRRGWAGTYVHRQRAVANQLINIAARKRFTDKDSFDQITLIGSSLNRLWHRESIDRMYEWLMQGNPGNQRKCRKVIFPNYGHQDLLWGKNAYKDVFPEIGKGLPKI